MHRQNHISFLSRHQTAAEQSVSESLKELFYQEIEPQTNIKIKIVYDTESILQSLMVEDPYTIKSVALIDDHVELNKQETLIQQTLWPDNCINELNGSNLPKLVNEALNKAKANNKKIVEVPVSTNQNIDSVSVIKNLDGEINNDIVKFIKDNVIKEVTLTGFGLDLAILETAKDIRTLFPEMEIIIIEDATLAYGKHNDELVRDFKKEYKEIFDIRDMSLFRVKREEMLII